MKCINAEVLKYRIKSRTKEGQKKVSIATVMDIIDCQLPVPTEQVVRCKDCEFFSKSNSIMGMCTLRLDTMFLNDFCSYGAEKVRR